MRRWFIYGFCGLFMFSSCLTFRKSDQRIFKKFKTANQKSLIDRMEFKENELRYIMSDSLDYNKPSIVFIHGAPGSGMDFYRYLIDPELQDLANLISVDRLGYGGSSYGVAEPSIEDQAEAIEHLIEELALENVTLFGWSYGVPIAVKLMHDSPRVSQGVYIAGAISPTDEKYFFLGKFVHWKLTRWMFSKALRVADEEKTVHEVQLRALLPIWSRLEKPVLYFHGTKDKIVPFVNMHFIKENLAPAFLNPVRIEGANHFLVFKEYQRVKDSLVRRLTQ